jgi:hypothetical protein
MSRYWIGLLVAFVSVGACVEDEVDHCIYLGTCAPVAAADAGTDAAPWPPPCAGQCVPGNVSLDSSAPWLVWMGAEGPAPACPSDAPNDAYDGVAQPAAPACGACSCEPSSGTCGLPVTAETHDTACPGTGSGSAFDAPTTWDGSCASAGPMPGGVASLTVAPLGLTESCSPQMVTTQGTPQAWQYARACGGQAPPGQCPNAADVCAPPAPADAWTYCVRQIPDDAQCPAQYPNRYTFARSWNDSRTCSPCACSAPEGSTCSSVLSVYSDGACSDLVWAVTAEALGSLCVDLPVGKPIGSERASAPVYLPGTCEPSGGGFDGGLVPNDQATLCCLD